MSNIRTQLEAAVKSLETYADELDAKGVAPSGEEIAEMKSRMAEITSLKEQVKAEAERAGVQPVLANVVKRETTRLDAGKGQA